MPTTKTSSRHEGLRALALGAPTDNALALADYLTPRYLREHTHWTIMSIKGSGLCAGHVVAKDAARILWARAADWQVKRKARDHARPEAGPTLDERLAEHKEGLVAREWWRAKFRRPASAWVKATEHLHIVWGPSPSHAMSRRKVWSSNGRWSGQSVERTLTLRPDWTTTVLRAGLAHAAGEGTFTLHVEQAEGGGVLVHYLRQGRGFDLVASTLRVAGVR